MFHKKQDQSSLTVKISASCKWRDAQCATDNLSVILWGLWNAMQGDDYLILRGGGGLSNFVWTDNLFSAWARSGNLFSCGMGSGKFLFVYKHGPVNHMPLRQLITRNSNVIESSSIRRNYYDKSSFDLATLCITTNLRHYTSLSLKKKMKSRPVTTLFQIIRRP